MAFYTPMNTGGALFASKGNVGVNTGNPTNPLHVSGRAGGLGNDIASHMALVENTNPATSDVAALKIGKTDSPESGNNFTTFCAPYRYKKFECRRIDMFFTIRNLLSDCMKNGYYEPLAIPNAALHHVFNVWFYTPNQPKLFCANQDTHRS